MIVQQRARLSDLLQRLNGVGWLLLLWVLLAIVLLIEPQLTQRRLEQGVVSQQNVRAPTRTTYVSELRTERERERAAAAVADIFSPPERALAIQQTGTAEEMARFLTAVRNDPHASAETKTTYVAALQPVQFEAAEANAILSMPEEAWQQVVNETLRVLDSQMRGEIRETRLPILLRSLPNQISVALSDEQAAVVAAWAGGLLTPNTFLDVERTEQARQAARDAVPPVEVSYEANQIVVREGEIVTGEQVEALQQMGLQQPARPAGTILATLLFLLLIVAGFGVYLLRMHPEHYRNPRVMALLVGLVSGLTLGARLVMPDHVYLSYLLPTAAAAMLLGVLLSVDLALIVTVVLSLIVGYLTNSMELISYTFIGGLVAALVLWRVERLGDFVWTGGLVGLTNVAIVAIFALREGNTLPWVDLASLGGVALLNGAASASLALVGFYVLSNLLGITTFLQLMELARPTHPLFRELLLHAPGTYHHSIVVSNLAEGAAEAIGADMLLVRVGAYYHDVGKLKNPLYFVENQSDGVNLHDALNDPYKSAEIIMEHVTHGQRLARKYKLPRKLHDFIAQHHGTTVVAWFHHRACEREGTEAVDVERFRYPGPKPQTREAAILMLADTVEATARAVKPAGGGEIDALIRKVFASKLGEGQLDECELNLRDMDLIRKAFLTVLKGIYHPRIAYPDDKKVDARSEPPALPDGSARPALASPGSALNGEIAHHDPTSVRAVPDEESANDPDDAFPDRPTLGVSG